MMKKLICLGLAIIICVSAAACGNDNDAGGATPDAKTAPPESTATPAPATPQGLGLDDWDPEQDSAYQNVKTYRDGDTFVKTDDGMQPVTIGIPGTAFVPVGCSVVIQARNLFYVMDAEGGESNTAFFAARRAEGETANLLNMTEADLIESLKEDFTDEITVEKLTPIQIDGNDGIMFDIRNPVSHILSRRYVTNYDGYTYTFQFQSEESKAIADDRGDKLVKSFKFGKVQGDLSDDPNFKLQKTLFGIQLYIPNDFIVMGMVGDYGIMCYTPENLEDNKLSLQVAFGPEEPDMLGYAAADMEQRLVGYYPDVKVAEAAPVIIGGMEGIKMVATGIFEEDGTEVIQTRYGVNYDSKAYWILYVTRNLSGEDDLGDRIISGVSFIETADAGDDTGNAGNTAPDDGQNTGPGDGEVADKSYTIVTSVYSMKVTYTGGWKNDKPSGYGTATASEDVPGRFGKGDTLSGNWVDGLLEGEGEYNSGSFKLVGTFVKGLKEGTVKQYSNGKYVGDMEFENGSPVS